MIYVEMSDKEINFLVMENCGEAHYTNYCNSWADAGPIIERERITITSALRRDWWDAIDISADIEVRHVNPLRAAMTVFLMMQEAK